MSDTAARVARPDRPLPPAEPLVTGFSAGAALRLLRPRQWVKNTIVLVPLLFSGFALDPAHAVRAALAFVLFCALASGIYALNDVLDREADRAHPTKRSRPVAAGQIAVGAAVTIGTLLLAASLTGAWLLSADLFAVAVAYILLNVLYNRWLKSMVILDVFAVAAFYVLRIVAGVAAIEVKASVWLLMCGGLLSLYISFAKRRHELVVLGDDSATHRKVLKQYDVGLLDQMSGVLLAVTVVAYIMYTLNSATAAEVGSDLLSYSTVFVLYGVFRYLLLVHRGEGGDPTETLLTDRALLINAALWLLYCGWVVYRA